MKKAAIYLAAAESVFEHEDFTCNVVAAVAREWLEAEGMMTVYAAVDAAIDLRREYSGLMLSHDEINDLWAMPPLWQHKTRVMLLLMMAAVVGDENV